MSDSLSHFAHSIYCDLVENENLNAEIGTDRKWQRDFGAPIVKNIIQSEFREEDWPLYETEKTQIEIQIELTHWLSYQNIQKVYNLHP